MPEQVAPSPQSLCDHPVYAHHVRGGEPLTVPLCTLCGEIGWDGLREQVADFRRKVLTEAAEAIEHHPPAHFRPETALRLIRRLAAVVPETTLSAPVPTERGQAGQRAEEGFDYDPGTPEERARYWKQRAETAWERGDEDALVITRLVRDQIRVQTALCWDVIEAAKAWRVQFEKPDDIKWPRRAALIAAVDALRDAGPHQHECACNRNWGGPCGPCVCEEPPRQGVWRLVCGAENIPPNQTYTTKGAAEDVMRLHDGACPGAHGVEFVPDAGTD